MKQAAYKKQAEVTEFEWGLQDKILRVKLADQNCEFQCERVTDGVYDIMWQGKRHRLRVADLGDEKQVLGHGTDYRIAFLSDLDLRRASLGGLAGAGSGDVISKMPGKVLDVKVNVGDDVAVGDALVVVEAMKMQNELKAEVAGKVAEICVEAGQSVEGGTLLLKVEGV
ncbi:MAG: acetyl-CoA carboxylase biotin carboxyl carrier protein subunit [Deltaproteobacteria bacterium]|nr:acetyl-CoA carboxylase biotin carboxyl carrier protein subunit [Deltaproteobacteria bacterium]